MDQARTYLDLAARAAMRAAGDVEPNPCVGAVIVRAGLILGIGHHHRYGDLHAEREALADCRRNGNDPRGATVFVTLEPCCHFGKQPPCTDALIEAGIAHVIAARRDPNPVSGGGAAVLGKAGIPCAFTDASPLATHLSDPFIQRIRTGRPWVIAKWAQTIDGRIATRTGDSRWISGPLMRRRVHRLRARVDAILTGAGTLRADDPLLTARDVPRIRRVARRIILTTSWMFPIDRKIFATAGEAPTTVAGLLAPTRGLEKMPAALAARGVDVIKAPGARTAGFGIDLPRLLTTLAERYDLTNILVEAGPRLLGSLFAQGCVDEAIVHIAPMMMGDSEAPAAAFIGQSGKVAELERMALRRVKRIGDEVELVYRKPAADTDETTATRT